MTNFSVLEEQFVHAQLRLDMSRRLFMRLTVLLMAFMIVATFVLWHYSLEISNGQRALKKQQTDLRSQVLQNRQVGQDNHAILECLLTHEEPCGLVK